MTFFPLFLAWNSGRLYKILQPDCWVIWYLLYFTMSMSQCLALKNSCTFCFVFPIRFFVVEDHILHATQGLVTRPFTDELWNMALSKIIAVLRTHSVGIHTQTYLQAEFVVLLILLTPYWHLKFQVHFPTITKNAEPSPYPSGTRVKLGQISLD